MTLKDWFKTRKQEQQAHRPHESNIDDEIGKLWIKCVCCQEQMLKKDIKNNMYVCPNCDYHFRINAKKRLSLLIDEGTFNEIDKNMSNTDPLNFVDIESYKEKTKQATQKTGLNDAVITGLGKIEGHDVAIAIMDFEYMGGSMGSVVGEKVTRLIEKALEMKIPVISVTASGGARMQESVLSLMQMAKTSCAVAKMNDAGLLYISVLTEPTFGGVTASFATIGDVVIAEKGARIGFAGRRVIEQTIRQKLPSDFQTAEYLLKYGQIDMITTRVNMKTLLARLIKLHKN